MNIQELIESGVIELYVANALPAADAAALEALAQQYPEVQAEIEDVQAVMQFYAQSQAVMPSEGLKDKILNNIRAEKVAQMPQPKPVSPPQPVVEAPPLARPASSLSVQRIWPLAASFVLAISTAFFFLKYNAAEQALNDCTQSTQKAVENSRAIVQDLQDKVDVLKSPETKTVQLLGSPLKLAPDAVVSVYWNKKYAKTYLMIQKLPEPPSDKQYQLWAIVDSRPVSAGVLNYDVAEIQSLAGFDKAEAFAITLEKRGGSDAPTLDKMYVMGNVGL